MENLYFSVDPEVSDGESKENLTKLTKSLQEMGYQVYRAPYVFSDDPEVYLRNHLNLDHNPSYSEQREAHIKWVDEADILLAEISSKSEGRSMIIQRALDAPLMGIKKKKIVLIKGRQFDRRLGRIVRGLIESGEVKYFEYDRIEEVVENWQELIRES